ncbi:MAG: PEP-CTERM sorting domain-containing protein [Phycisphaerae bacterium]|nr:PEP-CTERM sorting domain-containing protein [Phycisphaerae bacterium]
MVQRIGIAVLSVLALAAAASAATTLNGTYTYGEGESLADGVVTIGSNGNVGIVNIVGGSLAADTLYAARGTGAATITITSGQLLFPNSGSTGYLHLGYDGTPTATVTQTGGTVGSGNVIIGTSPTGAATYTISGGTLSAYSLCAGYDVRSWSDAGLGRLDVIGTAATVSASYLLACGSSGTLGFTVGSTGVSTIVARDTKFSAGATIDMAVGSGVTVASGTVFDLIVDQKNGISITNLALASGDAYIADVRSGWTLQRNAAGDTLQAVYTAVPEPATMGLLGLGVVSLVGRRSGRGRRK